MLTQPRVFVMGSRPVALLMLLLLLLVALVSFATANPDLHAGSGDGSREPRWATASPSRPSGEELPGQQFSLVTSSVSAAAAAAAATDDDNGEDVDVIATASATAKNNSVTNITAQLGASVFLPCKTHHSMERQLLPQVSWVRRRDWHILTSGTLTYTKEERFSVHHPEGSTEWTLAIKYVELADAGTYECQISTGGGIVSHLVSLNVVVPRAVIPGNGEYHVESGSTISLVCFIEQSPVAPQYIFWYHNSRMINYDRERGGVHVHIDTGPRVRSQLSVSNARPSDSGNYTCAAANTESASITVYITEANKIAAIQPRAVDAASSVGASVVLTGCLLLLAQLVTRQ
ncbi:opioid-binding protein/cell adhesion molecule homolog isoform X2 [Panulirus ornatus]|uniref:opioid-binding protein/cell adhesion molecule homolog isoform X2 n=1 Tax=Panulirus ornatus TaxID=150431 RepID=UPI003A863B0C